MAAVLDDLPILLMGGDTYTVESWRADLSGVGTRFAARVLNILRDHSTV